MNDYMYQLISSLPQQLSDALEIFEKSKLSELKAPIKNVVISGMGGSGIGGSILKDIAFNHAKVPVEVVKDYEIPAYVNENTLFIASSYSGNTEETLQATRKALDLGAQIKIVSSGGTMLDIAQQHTLDFIKIPGGFPPRACLGYSLVCVTGICANYQIISFVEKEIKTTIEFLDKHQQDIKTSALTIAKKLSKKFTAIYAVSGFNSAALRLQQQLNENAKQLAWSSTYPELNHNELVAWSQKREQLAVVVIKSELTHKRNLHRINISKAMIQPLCDAYVEIEAQGTTHLQQIIYLIHLSDFISWYLSIENKVDAMDIQVIEKLKSELAAIK